MNKWLERALLSAGAAVVSTTAIVTTAERPGKRKKRKKKGEKDGRGKDGALVDDEVPRSVGAQAAHDYRVGHDGGITTRDLLTNLKDAGKNAAQKVSTVGGYLIGRQKPPPPAGADDEPFDLESPSGDATPPKKRRKKVRKRVRRKVGERPTEPAGSSAKTSKKKRTRRGGETVDDLKELRDEAVKRAASAAAKHAADKSGLGDAARQIKESSGELWKKTEKFRGAVKDRVPEDLGDRVGDTLGEAGKGIARGARSLSEKLRTALSEERQANERETHEREVRRVNDEAATPRSEAAGEVRPTPPAAGVSEQDSAQEGPEHDVSERVSRSLRGFARWVEGPGAPKNDDDDESQPRRVHPTRAAPVEDVVEARDPTDPRPAVVTPKEPEGPPPVVVTPKEPEGPPPAVVEAKDSPLADDDTEDEASSPEEPRQ